MKTPYVVLRSSPAAAAATGGLRRGTRRGGLPPDGPNPGAAGGPEVLVEGSGPGITVELASLNAQELPDLLSEPGVADAAPVMPMKLVAPVGQALAAQAQAGTRAWGIDAVGAAQSALDGKGIVVAVLDTGIDPAHPAFAGVELARQNFTDESDDDTHGHGTHCAGTIFGRDVGGQRIGVARGVRQALIGKVLGKGATTQSLVQAIQWASEQGAHVVSMSLGTDFPGYTAQLIAAGYPEEAAVSRALEGYRHNVRLFETLAALLRAQALPTLVVAAAGNESARRAAKPYEVAVAPPATAEGFVSVAALGQAAGGLVVADFSNTGAMVAAPGVNVVSAKRGGGLVAMSGTSMATPHVAGVAALWAQQLKQQGTLNLTNLTARMIGRATLQGLANGLDTSDVGAGLVQAP